MKPGERSNDPEAPDRQRPPYWDRCREMDAENLSAFIEDSLKQRRSTDPGEASDSKRPHSEADFRDLWKMLREKAGTANPPADPQRYDPEARLRSLQAKLRRLLARQLEAYGAPSTRKRDIGQMRRRREELEEEIAQLRTGEHPLYSRSRPQPPDDGRSRIVTKVRKEIDRAFRPTEHFVHWRLLPPGELSVESVRRYYAGLQARNPHARYDLERIEKALSLGPHERHEEIDGAEGYIVFRFPYTSAALMECPKVGNAIYVIHSDWERWSRMSKQELMADESGEVVRIPHQGDWFEKVKEALGAAHAA